jgi:hypothetical protein
VSTHAPLAYPGGRTLAAWWRQLADRQPRALWASHLLLHHLEALVERTEQRRPDPIDLVILKVLVIFPGAGLDRLDQSLHMGPQMLGQVLRGLSRDGLVEQKGAGWNVSALGKQALNGGEYPRHVQERRRFYFRVAAPDRRPHFLPLHRAGPEPYRPAASWSFDPQLLQTAVSETPQWKLAYGFPLDVEKIVPQKPPPAHPFMPGEWKRVILDRPERLLAAMIQTTGEGGEHLLTFGVRQENWTLTPDEPVMTLGPVWPEVFPDATQAPPEAECRQAWQEWCQTHGLGEVASEASTVAVQGHLLQVTGSERLKSACTGAMRDESWLLIGTGLIRRAALLKIVVSHAG